MYPPHGLRIPSPPDLHSEPTRDPYISAAVRALMMSIFLAVGTLLTALCRTFWWMFWDTTAAFPEGSYLFLMVSCGALAAAAFLLLLCSLTSEGAETTLKWVGLSKGNQYE